MKKILSYILIVLIVVQIFAPFSVRGGIKNNFKIENNTAQAEEKCTVVSQNFVEPYPKTDETPRPDTITYKIETKNCIGKTIENVVNIGSEKILWKQNQITEDSISLTFNTGEEKCSGSSCDNIKITTQIIDVYGISSSKESASYKCRSSSCDNNIKWSFASLTGGEQGTTTMCRLKDVLFNPQTHKPDNRPSTIKLYISTIDCIGQHIGDFQIIATDGSNDDTVLGLDKFSINQDSSMFELETGEKFCLGGDCEIAVKFKLMDPVTGKQHEFFSSASKDENSTSRASYNCTSTQSNNTTTCLSEKKWKFISSLGATSVSGNTTVDIYFFTITTKSGDVSESTTFTSESACKEERENFVKNNTGNELIIGECQKKTVSQSTIGENDPAKPKDNTGFPACSIFSPSTYVGCIGIVLYYLLFRTTSFLFSGAGYLLDKAVFFSISDSSYRSEFVVQGWGLIRDFCNMFFIFILLYIAFGTILKLHSVKTKEMIVNVVIIGLLINFSLFAVQVIIDASNMLTRVFYNPQTIVIGEKENGEIKSKTGEDGEIRLSEAVVAKIDPQQILTRSEEINSIKVRNVKDGGENDTTTTGGISGGTFIIIVFLTTIINVIGAIAFLSTGIVFITRVIGLWFSMILAPLAFFSYIVPSLQDTKMIGWKNWWSDTLKMAFLAPIFMFFMYILIKFMDKGLGVFEAKDKTGMAFIISIMIPFVAIMAILMKAKDTASDMSGELGKSITKGISALGGMALGGAALGVAALGRGTIGAVAKYAQNDSKREKDSKIGANMGGHFTEQWKKGGFSRVNPLGYLNAGRKAIGSLGKGINANIAKSAVSFGQEKDASGNITKKGWLQQKTQDLKDKDHSEHVLNDATKKVIGADAQYKDLDEKDAKRVQNYVNRDIVAKDLYNGTSWEKLSVQNKKEMLLNNNMTDEEGDWSQAAEDTVVHRNKGEHTASHMDETFKKGGTAAGEFINALKKGSYDIRSISKLQTSQKGMIKAGIGLTALVAAGVRSGLKSGVGIEHGTAQKDFWKDIGNVISESLKGVKIEVPKAPAGHGGGGHGHDDHGGGGHGGGHH